MTILPFFLSLYKDSVTLGQEHKPPSSLFCELKEGKKEREREKMVLVLKKDDGMAWKVCSGLLSLPLLLSFFLTAAAVVDYDPLVLPNAVSSKRYAVVFDAGSSGSRVHVYCFGDNLELLPFSAEGEMELFLQTKPGLSAYASNPAEGAESLKPLLEEALNVIPKDLRDSTPVRLGATAGLRTLPGESANQLLEGVKDLLENSSLLYSPEWVSILDGTQEGEFLWVTINYLLGNIRKEYNSTVGVVDLGGGSVQMAYAISEKDGKNAPKPTNGEGSYVNTFKLLGKTYYLYVYSYLHYGLLAARAEIFKLVKDGDTCPCVSKSAEYVYDSVKYKVLASSSGPDYRKCKKLVIKALNKNQTCSYMKCTFGGIWDGGHGDGQKKLLVASFFFDRAVEAGLIADPNAKEGKVRALDFEKVARVACALDYESIGERFPSVEDENRPYFCLDLVYEYSLLVQGFGIRKDQEITLVKKLEYKKAYVETAWTLGSAIELIS